MPASKELTGELVPATPGEWAIGVPMWTEAQGCRRSADTASPAGVSSTVQDIGRRAASTEPCVQAGGLTAGGLQGAPDRRADLQRHGTE